MKPHSVCVAHSTQPIHCVCLSVCLAQRYFVIPGTELNVIVKKTKKTTQKNRGTGVGCFLVHPVAGDCGSLLGAPPEGEGGQDSGTSAPRVAGWEAPSPLLSQGSGWDPHIACF